jgi:hypothetical protein
MNMKVEESVLFASKAITSGCTGQIPAVTFCAEIRTKAAIKNLLGEPGVSTTGRLSIYGTYSKSISEHI